MRAGDKLLIRSHRKLVFRGEGIEQPASRGVSFHTKTGTENAGFFMPFFRYFSVFKRCVHLVHEFAFVFYARFCQRAPVLVRLGASDAPALKATHQAGRRGGESIARWRCNLIYLFLRSQRFMVAIFLYKRCHG